MKTPSAPTTYLRKEGLAFLRALVRANKKDPVEARDWFNTNKAVFQSELKEPMLAIIRQVTDAMLDFAPEHVRPAEKSLFRIYRDTRFANDKRPYKDHVAAWWTHTGLDKTSGAGYYFHIAAKEVTIAAGVYMPEKEQLAAVRHWLLDHHAEFRGLLNKPAVRKAFREFEGSALTRPPKGFPADHPAIDLIQCRQWGLAATLPVEAALSPKFTAELVRHFRLAAPMVAALNAPIAASVEPRKPVFFALSDRPKTAKTR
ncbi:DUF2461 domain-containing protein [Acidicapsa ligni]|uniref:DUF2461 domain-containing protein n=1 Tax=Acidicapsa ligni TaxID=542300 RepID=UPI0021E03C27|nr:DUF2461 domain-containing protein [Acidicapsa ligni]